MHVGACAYESHQGCCGHGAILRGCRGRLSRRNCSRSTSTSNITLRGIPVPCGAAATFAVLLRRLSPTPGLHRHHWADSGRGVPAPLSGPSYPATSTATVARRRKWRECRSSNDNYKRNYRYDKYLQQQEEHHHQHHHHSPPPPRRGVGLAGSDSTGAPSTDSPCEPDIGMHMLPRRYRRRYGCRSSLSSDRPFIYSFIRPSVHPSIRPFIDLSVYSFIHSFIHFSVRPSILLSIRQQKAIFNGYCVSICLPSLLIVSREIEMSTTTTHSLAHSHTPLHTRSQTHNMNNN